MQNEIKFNPKSRRDFLKTTSLLAASTMIMPFGASELFGANRLNSAKSSVPMVTLNNGLKMPILGFGTNTLKDNVGTRCVS